MELDPKLLSALDKYGERIDLVLPCMWSGRPAVVGLSEHRVILVRAGLGKQEAAPYAVATVVNKAGDDRTIQFYGVRHTVSFDTPDDALNFDSQLESRRPATVNATPSSQAPTNGQTHPVTTAVARRQTASSVKSSAEAALTTASVAIVLSTLIGILAIIGGIVTAFHSAGANCTVDSYGDSSCLTTDHPYVVAGLAGIIGAVFFTVLVQLIARYVRMRAYEALARASSAGND